MVEDDDWQENEPKGEQWMNHFLITKTEESLSLEERVILLEKRVRFLYWMKSTRFPTKEELELLENKLNKIKI